jgi:hypothetical protein
MIQIVTFHLKRNWCCLPLETFLRFTFICQLVSFPEYWGSLPFSKYWCLLPYYKRLRSSSIFEKNDVAFHFPKIEVVYHLQRNLRLSSNLGLIPLLYGSLVKFCSFPAISLLVRTGGWAAGRMLDIAKLKLNSASLVELGLGPSLAKWYFPSQVAVVIYMVIWPWQIPLKVISYALTWTYLKLKVESLHCKTFGFNLMS